MNDTWEYRKNTAKVGERCSHGTWWSTDCVLCIEEAE